LVINVLRKTLVFLNPLIINRLSEFMQQGHTKELGKNNCYIFMEFVA
jgi:hypothetical protein